MVTAPPSFEPGTHLHDASTRLDAVMADITALGEGTPEYHEAMWFLLSIMARRQAMIAEGLRIARRGHRARCEGSQTPPVRRRGPHRGVCGSCGGDFATRGDGTLRAHAPTPAYRRLLNLAQDGPVASPPGASVPSTDY